LRKITLLSLAMILISVSRINAQKCLPDNIQVKTIATELVQAPDFTIITTDGIQRNLYTTLNNNKSVLIDFFFTTCSPCQQNASTIEQAYIRYGSGTGNIEFWGISNSDNNAAVKQYKSSYGVSNPCAGTDGNGATVTSTYQNNFNFTGWPTYSVVCRNKTISWDVNWPPVSTGFDSYFTTCRASWGIEDYDSEKASIQAVYPVPAYSSLNIAFYLPGRSLVTFEFFDIRGEKIASYKIPEGKGLHTFELPVENLANGHYFFICNVDSKRVSIQKFVVMK